MSFTGMRRYAALAVLAALALAPAFPAANACFSACARKTARAAHACCRPRTPGAPLTVRAPGCCRPGSEKTPAAVVTAAEPAPKTGAALAASFMAIAPAAAYPGVAVARLLTDASPSPPPPFRTVLRI
jgi:hypothetical protein